MDARYKTLPRSRRYRFQFTTEQATRLPRYPGSAWRGLLGHGLRRVACVTRQADCGGCPVTTSCVYYRVFETRDAGDTANARPHPFVLDIQPGPREPARILELGLTLFEPAHDAFPFLLHGLAHAGRLGIGRERTPFVLERARRETTPGSGHWRDIDEPDGEDAPLPVPPAPSSVTIILQTPLRMKQRGRLIGAREFESAHFLRQLWRRANELHGPYRNGIDVPLPELKADQVETLDRQLRWHDWKRYSSRQRTTMNMGGLVGRWTLRHERLAEWWPMIWHGQWLHLGKATSMGLGRYRVESP
ncbi:MAG TPA: CRISPR system precrRNA processing endoribonuclease RAMP protein Cas6 [Chromatiaceae bacterium]|nr:CRISPR system precrRNA processing endoribonuclease RAMP protein Cas6 [Chromatiaceae bacterium]